MPPRYHPNDFKRWQRRRYEGFVDGKAPGASCRVPPEVKAHLATLLTQDRLWTASHLQEALAAQLGVPVHPSTLTRPLKRIRYVGSANLR